MLQVMHRLCCGLCKDSPQKCQSAIRVGCSVSIWIACVLLPRISILFSYSKLEMHLATVTTLTHNSLVLPSHLGKKERKKDDSSQNAKLKTSEWQSTQTVILKRSGMVMVVVSCIQPVILHCKLHFLKIWVKCYVLSNGVQKRYNVSQELVSEKSLF